MKVPRPSFKRSGKSFLKPTDITLMVEIVIISQCMLATKGFKKLLPMRSSVNLSSDNVVPFCVISSHKRNRPLHTR